MKIILSPSKTQDIRTGADFDNKDLQNFIAREELFPKSVEEQMAKQKKITRLLVADIKALDEEVIAKKMKLKGDLLDKVMKDYKNFNSKKSPTGLAALSYTGTVFKELHPEDYDENSIAYMHNHLYVLSALYGPTPAFFEVKSYRLDMNMSLFEQSLYQIWKPTYAMVFSGDELIVDLASKEFSKQVSGNMITVEFLVWQNERYKSVPFHSKQGRGLLADYMIKNCVEDAEGMKGFDALGYTYDQALSTKNHLVFKKNKKN